MIYLLSLFVYLFIYFSSFFFSSFSLSLFFLVIVIITTDISGHRLQIVGHRASSFPDDHDADRADSTGRVHRLPQKVKCKCFLSFSFSFFSCFHYQGWRATGFGFEHAAQARISFLFFYVCRSLFFFSYVSFRVKKKNNYKMERIFSFLKIWLSFFFLLFGVECVALDCGFLYIYFIFFFFFFSSSGFPIASIHNISHASHDFYTSHVAILLLVHDHLRCPTQSWRQREREQLATYYRLLSRILSSSRPKKGRKKKICLFMREWKRKKKKNLTLNWDL